jgi:hypothetical protein
MQKAEELIKRYGRAMEKRDRFASLYKQVYNYIMPDRYTQIEDKAEGQKNRLDLYTSVPEQAGDVFVQRIQELLTPINDPWIAFEAGYAYTVGGNDPTAVNQELEKIANICNVFKDCSNFDSGITSFYYDLIAGTAYLFIREGETADNPLIFKTIPFKEVVIEEGPDGLPDHYYREFKIKNELVKKTWADAEFDFQEEKAQEECELLECTYKEEGVWKYELIHKTENKVIVERVFKQCPFICLRWTKSSGEIYGRGPGLKCLSDVRTLNKLKEYSLRALGFTIPVFTASMDGGYDVDNFVFAPGAINPVPSNMTNNPTIQQLAVSQQPDLEQYNATQLEMNIKRCMFDTTIPDDPSQMTATEVNRRVAELAKQLNNSFGRLMNEFLYPLVKRIVEILQRFGHIDPQLDVNNFNGFGYKVKINTQLANQQKSQRLEQIMSFLSVGQAMDPTMQFISKVVKLDELAVEVAKLSGVPASLINTADDIKAQQQAEQQAMAAQQQQAMVDQVQMSNAIEKGKADAKRGIG